MTAPAGSPTAPTSDMAGEFINLDSARKVLGSAKDWGVAVHEELTGAKAQADGMAAALDHLAAGMSSKNMDPATLGEIGDLHESVVALQAKLAALMGESAELADRAGAVSANMDGRHKGIEEAVQSSQHPADMDVYRVA